MTAPIGSDRHAVTSSREGAEPDASLRAILAANPVMSKEFIAGFSPDQLAALFRRPPTQSFSRPAELHIREAYMTTRHGQVRVRIYTPQSAAPRLPAVLNIHGGGWVGGTIDMDDHRCATIALGAHRAVFSVDYSLAPDFRVPVALDQCEDVFHAIASGSSGLAIDDGRISICGSSAGGSLAVGTTLRVLAKGKEPQGLVLTYPVTDCSFDYPSYSAFSEGYLLTPAIMEWFWSQYIADEKDRKNPELVPMQIEALGHFPPSLIVTAECDILRDEAEAFATRLRRADVAVECHRVEGGIHGLLSSAPLHPKSQHVFGLIVEFLERLDLTAHARA